jgi:hypothetical protein
MLMVRRKRIITYCLLGLLLASLVGVQFVEVSANPLVGYNGPPFPNIRINSPKNQTIYNASKILLDTETLTTVKEAITVQANVLNLILQFGLITA